MEKINGDNSKEEKMRVSDMDVSNVRCSRDASYGETDLYLPI